MFQHRRSYLIFASLIFLLFFLLSCKSKHAATETQIVATPEEMDTKVTENSKAVLQYALDNNGKINDSIKLLASLHIVDSFYRQE